jgi:Kef-type K+ transport system membrane component KefB
MAALIDFISHIKPQYMILVQAAIVLLIPFLLWKVFGLGKFFPLAVIQILSGVLLGPTVFGTFLPDLQKALFGNPAQIAAVANIAICIFGFLAGTELDKDTIRKSGRSVVAVGVFGMLGSWVLAGLAGYFVYYALPSTHPEGSSPFVFAAAYGLAVAVCALPVLMLIMRDTDIMNKRLGAVTLASAGVSDAIMWIGLAVVIAFAGIGGLSLGDAILRSLLGFGLTFGVIYLIANPVLNRLLKENAQERVIISVTAVTIFVCAAITGITELHPVFGAFLAGAFLPDKVRHMAASRFDMTTVFVLMPFFFLATGLRTNFPYNDLQIWIIFGVSMALCVVTKVICSAIPARAAGEPWPFAISTGLLLQTKGLMGLLVITVFFQKEMVTQQLFSAIVVMCMVATAITAIIMRAMIAKYGDVVLYGKEAGTATAKPATSSPAPAH